MTLPSPKQRLLRFLLIPLLVMLIGSPFLVYLLFGEIPQKELFFGWLLNFFNAYLFASVTGKAIGRPLPGFFFWGLLGHGLRFGLLLMVLVAIWRWAGLWFEVVVAVTLFGYFLCLTGEVLALRQITLDMD